MKKLIQLFGTVNFVIFMTVLISWMIVVFIHGIIGAYAWLAIKFLIPFLGIIGSVTTLIWIIVTIVKNNKKLAPKLLAMFMYIILAAHLLLTMNLVQLKYPVHINNLKPSVTVKWPLAKQTVVGWGGDSTKTNLPHVIWPSERFAYDLVMEPYQTGSKNLEDYGIWNQEVLSPVSGIIVGSYDKESDIEPGSEEFLSMEGNYVYIKIDSTETYLLLNHLQKDSVLVKVGDRVDEGDLLGRVGNSGSTSEPHLHIHHQRQDPAKTIYPILAEGLPLYFNGIDVENLPQKGATVTPVSK